MCWLQLLVNLLWHPALIVRKAAEGVVLHAQKADDLLSESLFDAFSVEVSEFGGQFILLKTRWEKFFPEIYVFVRN